MNETQFKQFQDAMKQEPSQPLTTGLSSVRELDWTKAELHLASAEANLMKYAGKEEHNPYIMMQELNIPKLKKGLEFKRAEIYDAIMALPIDVVPHIKNLKSLEVE